MNGKSDKPSYKIFESNEEHTSQNNNQRISGLASVSQKVTSFLETIFYRYSKHKSDFIYLIYNAHRWGKLVTSWPKVSILSSLLMSGIFTSGMINWYQEMDQEVLWTPYNSPV